MQSGYPCLSLHGGKDQADRESTISDFKSNVCNVLVATSVAARGLDVKELVHFRHPPFQLLYASVPTFRSSIVRQCVQRADGHLCGSRRGREATSAILRPSLCYLDIQWAH